ncbi:MAG: alpha/beta fold hydrolase [Bdellovibrio sp.]|nr:alpha/beta fold hydrolase [Bdellovibrio sp.]
MSQGLVYALHGFLGQASDWNEVRKPLEDRGLQFHAENLFGPDSLVVTDFLTYVKELANKISQLPASAKKVFVGYSLGGRLGLHLMEHHPTLFDHYVFLSTNPGLDDSATNYRRVRISNDREWAAQITPDEWTEFNQRWNDQKVFEGSAQEPERNAADFDLAKLRKSLLEWSLGKQKDLSAVIKSNQDKLTWVVGDRDLKFAQIAVDLKQKKILLNYKRISSSHRIWLDNPSAISELLQNLY